MIDEPPRLSSTDPPLDLERYSLDRPELDPPGVGSQVTLETLRDLSHFKRIKRKILWWIKSQLNYFTIHVFYFFTLVFIGSGILHVSEDIKYIDALFMSASGACVTGLSTMPISALSKVGQVTIMMEMLLGGMIFMTIPPLFYRYAALMHHKSILQSQTILCPTKKTHLFGSFSKKFLPFLHKRDPDTGLLIDDRLELTEVNEFQHRRKILHVLIVVVTTYWLALTFCGTALLCIITTLDPKERAIRNANGINATFFGFFHAISGSSNTGFSLFESNMVAERESWHVLVVMGTLVLLGNTSYPVALRVIFWLLYHLDVNRRLVYADLLTFSRKHYSHLFGARTTQWLLFTLIINNIGQWLIVLGLNWNMPIFSGLSDFYKVLNMLFQSICTRTGGFNSLNLAEAHPSSLVLICGLMYISAFPVLISVRQSNVEEVQLDSSRLSRMSKQLKMVMMKDLVFLFLALFFVTLFESPYDIWQTNNITEDGVLLPGNDQGDITIFAILFELVSGYGTVGLTFGVRSESYGLSGGLSSISKAIVILVMFCGRHRQLPVHADPAVRAVSVKYDRD